MLLLQTHIETTIAEFSSLIEFIQKNREILKALPIDSQRILIFTDSTLILKKVVTLLTLRDNSLAVIEGMKKDDGKSTVEFNGVNIPFSSARLFSIQSYLSCLWSAYDFIAAFGRKFLHKNTGLENCSLNKMFLSNSERGTKIALEMLTNTR